MDHWDYETDMLVVGSGSGGMATAFAGKLEGLDTLILAKKKMAVSSPDFMLSTVQLHR